jgi:phosphoribosyl-ATP pyrophosphohydrolase/phosphoribosyl-AMP cyclohydrolase/histidinol dehydrogenase
LPGALNVHQCVRRGAADRAEWTEGKRASCESDRGSIRPGFRRLKAWTAAAWTTRSADRAFRFALTNSGKHSLSRSSSSEWRTNGHPYAVPSASCANMALFLPFQDQHSLDAVLLDALNRIGPVLITASSYDSDQPYQPYQSFILLADPTSSIDQVIQWLDEGASKVVVGPALANEIAGKAPANRLLLVLDATELNAVSDKLRAAVSGVLLKVPTFNAELVLSIKSFFANGEIYILPASFTAETREAKAIGATLVIPTSNLTVEQSTDKKVNVGEAFVAPITSDRADHLIPTVVTSYSSGQLLGLVYSSVESIKESILTGAGVYQSRKHGRWKKGETSGATQTVVSIRADCDHDSLVFTVIQTDPGFCHLNRPSCFGPLAGLAALEATLQSRLTSAPHGSYTQRLFKDPQLLANKVMEEAKELCLAQSKEDVTFEAADLLYFAMTKCVASGVTLADIEQCLDEKAKKVTRRKGDAKPEFIASPPKVNGKPPAERPYSPIQMRHADLATVSAAQRSALLRRPVLNSRQMIEKVRPIVDEVRRRGDTAVFEFTAQYDKVQLKQLVIRGPFYNESTGECLDGSGPIDPAVREAIDKAYDNVRKFHEAQVVPPLRIETSPGVICERFTRPIARVGLYVPGGTAILPSSGYMLGVPAQVAGCEEIVFATPPREDGSISPEMMYVAHKVGATALLKAGGAQAIAALAYGTETCPKVDKIFGPGNQWVTGAKMLVQGDTDALVAIDLPAGPSEVLVSQITPVHCCYFGTDPFLPGNRRRNRKRSLCSSRPSLASGAWR